MHVACYNINSGSIGRELTGCTARAVVFAVATTDATVFVDHRPHTAIHLNHLHRLGGTMTLTIAALLTKSC